MTSSTIESLATAALPYTGEAPYGSCVHQIAANALEFRGLQRADAYLGVTCGTTWVEGDQKLGASLRWADAISTATDLSIQEHRAGTWDEAWDAEQAALARGASLLCAVDSFDIPSPHRGARHLMHAVLVTAARDAEVTFRDAMNAPAPATMSLVDYAATRAAEVVPGYRFVTVEGSAQGAIPPAQLISMLAADVHAHGATDVAALEAFVASDLVASGAVDVADVAAERLYNHRLVAMVSESEPDLAPVASAFGSLSRRWYLVHTLALEAAAGRPLKPGRLKAVLSDVVERETALRDRIGSLAVRPEPVDSPDPNTQRRTT